jgi:alpha-ketoglutarate-dependent taurine dioxygenase
MDRINFDPHTFQRTGVRFDIGNGKPLNVTKKQASVMYTMTQCVSDGSFYHITWGDGHVSTYSTDWLDEMLHNWDNTSAVTSYEKGRVLWKDLNEDTVRTSNLLCLSFQEAITDDGMKGSLKALHEYGFVLVTDTPIDDGGSGVAALASALGGGSNKDEPGNLLMHYRAGHFNEIMLPRGTDGPLRTLYGTVWSTASVGQAIGTSTADSSYGTEGLPLHTDMTYKYDPPGLQIFTMIQPAAHGGESVICDGFAVAAKLRDTHPDAFRLLCETTRRYHCIDQATGWHMEASGPIIGVDNNKQIIMIRHNDLDRLPDLPSPTATDFHSFYAQLQSAHSVWDELLSDDAFRLVLQLRPGDTIVVANQVSLRLILILLTFVMLTLTQLC